MLRWAKFAHAYNVGDRQTHVFRSAEGFLNVGDDKQHEFQKVYCEELPTSAATGVVVAEVPSDMFPMFVQVAHVDKQGLTKDGMIKICGVIAGVLNRYYPDVVIGSTLLEAVCFQNSSEEVTIHDESWTKRVFSLVFRNLIVDEEQALQMRHTIVQELNGQLGSLPCSYHQWSSAISNTVYMQGVVMYGQGHCATCPACLYGTQMTGSEAGSLQEMEREYIAYRKKVRRSGFRAGFDYSSLMNAGAMELASPRFREMHFKLNKLRQSRVCAICHGKGVQWKQNQSPLTTIALDGSGNECVETTKRLQEDTAVVDIVRMTSVRAAATQQKNSGYVRPLDTPIYPSPSTADNLRAKGIMNMNKYGMTATLLDEVTHSDIYETDVLGLLAIKGKKEEKSNEDTVRRIERFIRHSMGTDGEDKMYKNVQVKSVFADVSIIKQRMTASMKAMSKRHAVATGHYYEPARQLHLHRLLVRVQGRGSCYCRNIGGYHASNTVYFELGPDQCWQRCFCGDDTTGVTGTTCAVANENRRGGVALPKSLLGLFLPVPSAAAPVMPQVELPTRNNKHGKRKLSAMGQFWDASSKGKTPKAIVPSFSM
ncbi:unnamed protein product [Ectocarpus sp. 8 AP-2014]